MLEVKNLTKVYSNKKNEIFSLKNVSFKLMTNKINSILGLNGAGKSSIINCITGYCTPNSGTILIDNVSVLENEIDAKRLIGILYEQNPLYGVMTVYEFLFFCAEMHNVSKQNIKVKIKEVMEFCEIEDYSERLIKNLSKGYKQRVGLAQAILNNPKLLILDEATSGLDAINVKNLEKKILQIADTTTILMATHNLKQAADICSNHIMINSGEIIAQGTITEIQNQLENEGCKFNKYNPESILEEAFIFLGVNKNEFRKIV